MSISVEYSEITEPFNKIPNLKEVRANNIYGYTSFNISGMTTSPNPPQENSYEIELTDGSVHKFTDEEFNTLIEQLYKDTPFEEACMIAKL